ncbi:hypothetical protein GPJ59_30455, partial [Streptomyces bambusae]|nr:hypothetical protein [Streptomyces bambusae]
MTDYVKHLPPGALPHGGVRTWGVARAERWRAAGTPAWFAPAAGSWALAGLVALALVLVTGNGTGPARGTDWWWFCGVAPLVALPLWFRHLPAATLLLAPAAALAAAVSLGRAAAPGGAQSAGWVLGIALAGWAAAGAAVRLRSRARKSRPRLVGAGMWGSGPAGQVAERAARGGVGRSDIGWWVGPVAPAVHGTGTSRGPGAPG